MARKAKVGYYKTKKGFYCTIDHVRHRLADGPDDSAKDGPNYRRAVARYAELVCDPLPSANAVLDDTVEGACRRYRQWLADTGKQVQADQYDCTVGKSGLKLLGHLKLSGLKPHHLDGWLTSEAGWGPTTRFHGWTTVKHALKWNTNKGHVTVNPLAGIKCPSEYRKQKRGADFALSNELLALLIETSRKGQRSKRFADYLYALSRTGARPGELAYAEPCHYHREAQCIVFSGSASKGYLWKNARKTGKDRVIYLPADVAAVVEANIRQGRKWLFPTETGNNFGLHRGMQLMGRLRRKKPVAAYLLRHGLRAKSIILYAMRHTYATRALKNDPPVAIRTLAELMGTSVGMIERHYGHLCGDKPYLRRVFDSIKF